MRILSLVMLLALAPLVLCGCPPHMSPRGTSVAP